MIDLILFFHAMCPVANFDLVTWPLYYCLRYATHIWFFIHDKFFYRIAIIFLDIMILGEVSCCSVQYGISRLSSSYPGLYLSYCVYCT